LLLYPHINNTQAVTCSFITLDNHSKNWKW